jgi:hypothetical protein
MWSCRLEAGFVIRFDGELIPFRPARDAVPKPAGFDLDH